VIGTRLKETNATKAISEANGWVSGLLKMRNRMLKLNLHGFTGFITGPTPARQRAFLVTSLNPTVTAVFLAFLSAGSRGLRL
jgi:hypothetical protein